MLTLVPQHDDDTGEVEHFTVKHHEHDMFSHFRTIMSRSQFPDLYQVLPDEQEPYRVILDPDELRDALSAVSPTMSSKTNNVRLHFHRDRLEVYASDPDTGETTVPVHAECWRTADGTDDDGDRHDWPIKVGFNRSYLKDALKGLPSEVAEVQPIDPLSPTLIASPTDPDSTRVIMPMRL